MFAKKTTCPLQLEGKTQDGSHWVIPITSSPFVIGRKPGCDLHLPVEGISRVHAEIHEQDGNWWIKDCGSTNGTFVNHRRLICEQMLQAGDALQLADLHFTVTSRSEESERTQIVNPHARQFEGMMQDKAVTPYFQPIIRLSDHSLVAYEILGRAHYQGLPESPGALFQIAKKFDRDIELSQLFRERGFALAERQAVRELLFFNMLPQEMDMDTIGHYFAKIKEQYPTIRLAMELHESVVTDVPMITKLKRVLKEQGIYLVYDDFGAGQARLLELIEAPPDVIKFDIALIHGIDSRPQASKAIVAALVKMAKEAGIRTLAEGVETPMEATFCKQLGFDLAQGFYFGKPSPKLGGEGKG